MKDYLLGQVIGQYHVQQLLVSKPSEVVYLAEHCESRHPVALTLFTVPPSFSNESRVLLARRFQKGAESLLALQHRSIFPLLAYGIHFSCPYLVTPYRTSGSLTDLLKKRGIFHLESLQPILEQVTAGLTYAHHNGCIHGTLKTSYILMQTEKTVQIAGFGLWQLLHKQGIEQIRQPHAHLFGISDTLVVSLAYVAPEVVEGKEPDVCADVYGLGCILYELLAGKPPIVGNDPLQTALLQTRQMAPDLQRFRPDLPQSVIAVLSQALAKDPAQRFQQISHLTEAFVAAQRESVGQISLARSVVQQPEAFSPQSRWQIQPSIIPSSSPEKTASTGPSASHSLQTSYPARLSPPVTPTRDTGKVSVAPSNGAEQQPGYAAAQPWWMALPPLLDEKHTTKPIAYSVNVRKARGKHARPVNKKRQTIRWLAAAGVVVATGMTVTAVARLGHGGESGAVQTPVPSVGGAHTVVHHLGAMVGSSTLPRNAFLHFVNPADQKVSILIHLANGNFVAYERACTHVGISVDYDPQTQTLICPAHGAVFDPAHDAAVLQGPATRSLTPVAIQVNSDGSITTGTTGSSLHM